MTSTQKMLIIAGLAAVFIGGATWFFFSSQNVDQNQQQEGTEITEGPQSVEKGKSDFVANSDVEEVGISSPLRFGVVFDVSLDGNKIVYIESEGPYDGIKDAWIADIDGKNSKQVTYGQYLRDVAWSPDGNKILIMSVSRPNVARTVNDFTGFFVTDANGNVLYKTEQTNVYSNPVWSPDGNYIAFSDLRCNCIAVMDANGQNKKRLTTPPEINWDWDPQWTPNGQQIVYAAEYSSISIVNKDGIGQRVVVASPDRINQGFGSPIPFNNGKTIAYTVDIVDSIWIVNADSTSNRKLFDLRGIELHDIFWHPNAPYVLFKEKGGKLWLMNTDSGEKSEISPWAILPERVWWQESSLRVGYVDEALHFQVKEFEIDI